MRRTCTITGTVCADVVNEDNRSGGICTVDAKGFDSAGSEVQFRKSTS